MSTAQRIQRARAALRAQQDDRYQRTRRTAQAVVTSVNRDSSTGHTDGTVWATIDGVSDQLIFVGAGTGVSAGDVLRVENRGSGLAPDWTLIGKTTAVQGAEGLVDIGRPLSTPTGLTLSTAVYTPTAGNLRARLTATWTQIGIWEGVGSYRAQLRRDFDGSIQAATTPHDTSTATTSLSWSELEPGIAYSVRVQALGYGGSASGWTSWASITTAADTTAPATPSGLSAAQVDARTLRATWTANSEADLWYYQIDASLDGSASVGGAYPLGTGASPHALIPTQPGVGIYLRLRATDTSGNASAWSSWSGPHTTAETVSLAGLVYLQPRAELIAALSSGASTVDVSAALFESGEFAHILTTDGATEEIVKFASGASTITGGHRYSISRAADGGTAQSFAAGTPIYMLGQRGYILADSRDDGTHTDTPFLDIFAWDNPYTGTWGDKARQVRLGKLDGITDTDLNPAGFGLYSTNTFLKGSLIAGGGAVILNDDGIAIAPGSSLFNKIRFTAGADTPGSIYVLNSTPNVDLSLEAAGNSTINDARFRLFADSYTGGKYAEVIGRTTSGADISLEVSDGTSTATLTLDPSYSGNRRAEFAVDELVIGGGTISTDSGTTKWALGGYTATPPAATGYVTITIGGTTYKLIAAT